MGTHGRQHKFMMFLRTLGLKYINTWILSF
jgi:hypothetical protein